GTPPDVPLPALPALRPSQGLRQDRRAPPAAPLPLRLPRRGSTWSEELKEVPREHRPAWPPLPSPPGRRWHLQGVPGHCRWRAALAPPRRTLQIGAVELL